MLMLTQLISDFINYTEQVNFRVKSREVVTSRLNQLAAYCESHNIHDVNEIIFQHLLRFVLSSAIVLSCEEKQNPGAAPVFFISSR